MNMAHRLRGVSGSLAAGDVAAAANALEERLNRGESAGLDELLAELERALTEAFLAASLLPGYFTTAVREQTGVTADNPVNIPELLPLLKRLQGLLLKNSMRARDEVSSVSEQLRGTPLGTKGRELETALAKFNYGTARGIVTEMATLLEIVL
jgi:two-component system, sensor histidine kinase and response regulator